MARLGRGFPNNQLRWQSRALVRTPITFDAVGAGKAANATSWSWSHAISGNAVLVFLETFNTSAVATPGSVQVGATSMTLLSSITSYYTSFGFSSVFAYGLLNPPTGTQTITATCAAGSQTAVNSVSYGNVTAFGTPIINSGTGTAMSLSAPTASYQMVPMVFSDFNSTVAGYNQTTRYHVDWVNNSNLAVLIGDAQGSPSLSFSLTGPSAGWGAIAIPLA